MTQRQRAIHERDMARAYEGPGAYWALMGEIDWEVELSFIAEDEEPPTNDK